MTSPAMDVSVVIPVLNAERTIGSQLDALARQDYDGTWEILLALQDCDDDTPGVIERRGDPRVRVIDASERRGAGFARNTALRAARSELVAFCDADDIVSDHWLSALVANSSAAPVLAGATIPFTGDEPPAGLLGAEQELPVVVGYDQVPPTFSSTSTHDAVRLLPAVELDFLPAAYTCSMLARRSALLEVGGFDLRFHRSHDVELSWHLQVAGHDIAQVPDAVVYKRQRPNVRRGWMQAFRWARYDPALYRDYARHGMPRSDTGQALRSWWWVLSRAPFARGERRRAWSDEAAVRAGRIYGSLAERVLYL